MLSCGGTESFKKTTGGEERAEVGFEAICSAIQIGELFSETSAIGSS